MSSDLTILVLVEEEDAPKRLRFPPFHPDILKQAHWEPAELYGRILVVISEGVVKESSPRECQDFSYRRLRDVVFFSFQHAPRSK